MTMGIINRNEGNICKRILTDRQETECCVALVAKLVHININV